MSKILVISGHPHLDRSNMNAAILESLEDKFNGDILEVRRLDELYPDFNIDAKAEQEALVDADIIVLQFPIYWYNVPSLLKKWIEDVLEYGFAYGSSGTALHGKKLLLSFTAGSGADVYHEKMAHDLPDFTHDVERVSWEDGCKVYFEDGWIIARFSGTEPLLRIFCEMPTLQRAELACEEFGRFLGL